MSMKVLALLLVLGFSVIRIFPSKLISNLSWIQVVEFVISPDYSPDSYLITMELVSRALFMDNAQPRLISIQGWLENFDRRLSIAAKTRESQDIISDALDCTDFSRNNCEKQVIELQSLIDQTNDSVALLALAYIHEKNQNHNEFTGILKEFDSKSPQFPINNDFSFGELRLEGYDILPISVGVFSSYRIVVYWNIPVDVPIRLDPYKGLYQFNHHLLQVIVEKNHIPNGDFEWISMNHSLPPQWSLMKEELFKVPSVQKIVDPNAILEAVEVIDISDQSESENTYIEFRNLWERTFLSTIVWELDADTHYLLMGQFQASDGSFMQLMQNVDGTNLYPGQIHCVTHSLNNACGSIFSPKESGYVYLQIYAQDSSNVSTKFDNIGIFKIDPPIVIGTKTHD